MTNEASSGLFMARRRVLVVDDLAPVVAALLRESFDVVGMVSDGQAALESTLKLSPDLIVLAISMPGMSGIPAAQELKRRGNNAKIVFLTVHEGSDILATALAAGGLGLCFAKTSYTHKINDLAHGTIRGFPIGQPAIPNRRACAKQEEILLM